MILRGSEVASAMKERILEELSTLNVTPKLAVLRVGSRPDDLAYERGILKRFDSLGLSVEVHELPEGISQSEFDEEFSRINRDPDVHGILLFRPLPSGLSDSFAVTHIDPRKDLDCMSPVNIAGVFAGNPDSFAPCTASAVMQMLEHYGIDLQGQNVAIVGRSMVIGRPLAMLMLSRNATVTICHTKTRDLAEICRRSDVIVAAAGKAKMLTREYVSDKSVVVDVGINVDENGKLCGDVDFDSVERIVRAVSPVPGGVGTVTTSVLAANLVRAAKLVGRRERLSSKLSGKKILNITLCSKSGNGNYGNVLQHCALATILNDEGFGIDFICLLREPFEEFLSRAKRFVQSFLASMGIKMFRRRIKLNTQRTPKKELIESFRDKYAGHRIYAKLEDVLTINRSRWKEYAFAVVGSDLVWKERKRKTISYYKYFYLGFIERAKRVAYAPSFGSVKMPEGLDLKFRREGLDGFKHLSCREPEGCELIRRISGREAQHVLDPTLLLDADTWRTFSAKPDYELPQSYVLCYFLGDIVEDYNKVILTAAGINLPIIHIDHRDKRFRNAIGPAEFLYLFDNAAFVCTDSFHGTAFSIIFQKNFLAFKRKERGVRNLFGRIESLLESLGITGHVYDPYIDGLPDEIDYDAVNSRLDLMRKSSMNYLRECLS